MRVNYREALLPDPSTFMLSLGRMGLVKGRDWDTFMNATMVPKFWVDENKIQNDIRRYMEGLGLPMWGEAPSPLHTPTPIQDIQIPDEEVINLGDFTHYEKDGKKYARVSNIVHCVTDSGLKKWRGIMGDDEADRQMKYAGDWGTMMHSLIQVINETGDLPDNPDPGAEEPWHAILPKLLSYLAYKEEMITKILHTEKVFLSKKYGFGCTIDLIALLKGNTKPRILDIKTGAIRRKHFELQMGLYQIAAEENGIVTADPLIIPISRKGDGGESITPITLNNMKEAREAGLAALQIYRYMTGERWEGEGREVK
jgi:hypothetical protein